MSAGALSVLQQVSSERQNDARISSWLKDFIVDHRWINVVYTIERGRLWDLCNKSEAKRKSPTIQWLRTLCEDHRLYCQSWFMCDVKGTASLFLMCCRFYRNQNMLYSRSFSRILGGPRFSFSSSLSKVWRHSAALSVCGVSSLKDSWRCFSSGVDDSDDDFKPVKKNPEPEQLERKLGEATDAIRAVCSNRLHWTPLVCLQLMSSFAFSGCSE